MCSLNLNVAIACFDLQYFSGEKSRAFQIIRAPCHVTIKEYTSSRWRLRFVMIFANNLCSRGPYKEGSIDGITSLEVSISVDFCKIPH